MCVAGLLEARGACVVLVPGKAVLGATSQRSGFHFSVTYLVCSLFLLGGLGVVRGRDYEEWMVVDEN